MESIASFGILQSLKSWYGAALIGLIALMSIYMLALAVIRTGFFRAIRMDARKLTEEVLHSLDSNEAFPPNAGRKKIEPPLQVLAYTILANRTADISDLQDLVKVTLIRQRERLERGQSTFGTFAAVGPFLGLLATVLGIIHSFEALALSGSAGPNVVASGVAEALWGTAAGLVLAIPAVVLYNLFNRKAKAAMVEMELTAREILVLLKGRRQRVGAK
jgi:biopolymer transport protein ExbB